MRNRPKTEKAKLYSPLAVGSRIFLNQIKNFYIFLYVIIT